MIDRRQFFLAITALLSELAFSKNPNERLLLRAIPSSGERIPVIGMGTSRTFDLKPDENFGQLMEVLESFFIGGGTVIDSSPMYCFESEQTFLRYWFRYIENFFSLLLVVIKKVKSFMI